MPASADRDAKLYLHELIHTLQEMRTAGSGARNQADEMKMMVSFVL